MKRHDRMIERAMDVARNSPYESPRSWKLGAVIAKGNRVIAYAPNKLRNAPTTEYWQMSYHAEEAAIKGGKRPRR